jgi:filamentous hemagglutinin family protein
LLSSVQSFSLLIQIHLFHLLIMKIVTQIFPAHWQLRLFQILVISGLHAPLAGLAQIVPDATLPTNSIVPLNCTACTITGGTVRGANLFHSFNQFSVPALGSAVFQNAPTIQTIFARVTGPSASNINGILGTQGAANLFLMNPNGITFGPGAKLQLGGSFMGTTAQSIRFEDGFNFSTSGPTDPLLSIKTPIGLQYGTNPAPIQVNGPGHNLALAEDFVIDQSARPVGLEVLPGQTLALVGGNVNLTGGNLTASGGRVELGSVGDGQFVSLAATTPVWKLGYEQAKTFGDIQLSQASSVDTSSNTTGNGAINIQGRSLQVLDGSALLGLTLGTGQGQPITIQTTDQIKVQGFQGTIDAPLYPTMILTDTGIDALDSAIGGTIRLTSRHLQVLDGAVISASTLGAGAAGSIQVTAKQVDLKGEVIALGIQSGLFSQVLNSWAEGNSGTVQVTAETLNISSGAQIATVTDGIGKGGLLQLNAGTINLDGMGTELQTGLASGGSKGDGGLIQVTSQQLNIIGGAQINGSAARGGGRGGDIVIQSVNTNIIGSRVTRNGLSLPSGIFSTVRNGATGQAGHITLMGDRLRLAEGAQIATATSWSGDAGNINLTVKDIELIGGKSNNANNVSGIISSSVLQRPRSTRVPIPAFTGKGGIISVVADRLVIRDGATMNVSNFPTSSRSTAVPGNGAVGNIDIRANSVLLKNGGTLTTNSLGGDLGNIMINSTESLILRNGSRITTNAFGQASGGNIFINSGLIVGPTSENSDITANAIKGRGGNIQITTQGIFGLKYRDRLTPLSDITASSEFGLNGTVQINNLGLDPSGSLTALPNDLSDSSRQISNVCRQAQNNKFIITGRGGMPPNPGNVQKSTRTWKDLRTVDSTSDSTSIANVPGPTQASQASQASLTIVEATAIAHNPQTGDLELVIGKSRTTPQGATCSGVGVE